MSDWSVGYPTDLPYSDAVQPAISPWRWQQAMAFGNRRAPAPGKPFRFLELGCGSALNLIALAAAYPQARFDGYDFMPEHVFRANALIDEIGLENVAVHEGSFAEMAASLPETPYDFAATHGVWSWVPESVRADLAEVLAGWLAPGGVFYVGYNTAAGWSASEPIRQIFRTAAAGPPGDRYGPARKAVDDWLAQTAALNRRQPMVEAHWGTLRDSEDSFISHELANPFGTGLWMEQVAEVLDRAKLSWAGPAVMAEHMDGPFLGEDQLALLRRAIDEGWGETARDLLHARFFRKDLYHRGARAISGRQMVESLRDLRVIPWALEPRMSTHLGVYKRLKHDVPEPVASAIRARAAEDDARLGDLMDMPELDPQQAVQAVLLTYVSGHLLDRRPQAEIDAALPGCTRFNTAMLRRAQRGEPLPGLVSPVLGGTLQLPPDTQKLAFGEGGETSDAQARLATLGIATEDS